MRNKLLGGIEIEIDSKKARSGEVLGGVVYSIKVYKRDIYVSLGNSPKERISLLQCIIE